MKNLDLLKMPTTEVSPRERSIHPMFVVIAAVAIIFIIVGLFIWLEIERDDSQGS